ncbi:MAG: glycosyltransferase family 39 protein [Planctomycetaceae bacterium]|jgi:4-amino-4-deoxy-L-arabinose transferase-like glycosyltransferase|nr:glycosyltransferase family 39 protein [Planctomycetaceae bacterium]
MQINFKNIILGETSCDRLILFVSALLIHVLFWTFAPLFFMSSYQIDTIEMMAIGRNWVISTLKHPAFQGWFVEVLSWICNWADFVPYLATQIATVLSVVVVWKFAQKILSPKLALLAALTLLSYSYFHYDSTMYNNLTFFRFFWIASIYFLYLALESDKKRYWILTGVSLGLGIYCIFAIGVLVGAILIFMFVEPRARKYWRTPGPYISTGVCFLIVIPLLIWIVQHNFSQFNYMSGSIGKKTPALLDHFLSPVRFVLTQIPIIAMLLIPAYPIIGFRWRFDIGKCWNDTAGRYLTFFVFAPFLLQIAIAFIFAGDMRTALGCHLWLLLPMFLFYAVKISEEKANKFPRAIQFVYSNILLFAVITILVMQTAPIFTGRDSRYHFPSAELTQSVRAAWSSKYSEPLPFVRGDDYLSSSVAVSLRPNTNVYSPLWSKEEDFKKRGGILIWFIGEPGKYPRRALTSWFGNKDFKYSLETGGADKNWLEKFPNAEILPPIELHPNTIVNVPPIKIGIAIVPPEK